MDRLPYATKLLGRPPPILKCRPLSPTNLVIKYGGLGGLDLPIRTDNPIVQQLFTLVRGLGIKRWRGIGGVGLHAHAEMQTSLAH